MKEQFLDIEKPLLIGKYRELSSQRDRTLPSYVMNYSELGTFLILTEFLAEDGFKSLTR